MSDPNLATEAKVLHEIITRLALLDEPSRIRLLDTMQTYFGHMPRTAERPSARVRYTSFSEQGHEAEFPTVIQPSNESETAKEFILRKNPRTFIDRVACLGYYLAHYLDTPHFRTIDISKVNTEAAQTKFSSTSVAVDNATKQGLLVPAKKGYKQLSALGEEYVRALPDIDAARDVKAKMKKAGKRKRPKAREKAQPE